MDRIITRGLVLLTLVVVGWAGVVFLAARSGDTVQSFFRQYSNIPTDIAPQGNSSAFRFREITDFADVDILFIGSSHSCRAFDTRIFARYGYTSFNMGSTSQTYLNSYYLLKKHIDRLNPKLIIVETYYRLFSSDGVESVLDLSINLPPSESIWDMALATMNFRALNAALLRTFTPDEEFALTRDRPIDSTDMYVSGGYLEKAHDFTGAWQFDTVNVDINPEQFDYLEKILDMASSRGAAVALVEQPTPSVLRQATLNLDEVRDAVGAFARRHDLVYLEFNQSMDLKDDTDFFDYHHLHQKAVERFNEKLIAELSTRNVLPTAHRSESTE